MVKFSGSDVKESELLINQIQSYSNTVAVSGHIMENFNRTGPFNLPHFVYDGKLHYFNEKESQHMYNLPSVLPHQISDNKSGHSVTHFKLRWSKDDDDEQKMDE